MKVKLVCGLDLGDKSSAVCLCDAQGEVLDQRRISTKEPALARYFQGKAPLRIALEVGPHSPWVSRLLSRWGHEVLVANPRKVKLIGNTRRKSDRIDAQSLADLAGARPRLLHPIQHRTEKTQQDRVLLQTRDALVRSRSRLISHVRGLVKSLGGRLPSCSAETFAKKAAAQLPAELKSRLSGTLTAITELTVSIRDYHRQIQELLKTDYPQGQKLLQIQGVGPITALTFVLTLGEPGRFAKSRTVGAYLGLVPAQRSSGESHPQLRISKEGDPYLRRLLVQCAHYILGPHGADCDLRRFGQRLSASGGKSAKKRATVAVARKLSVVLHRLLVTGQDYEALRSSEPEPILRTAA
ncbi:MAG TPA: IS110 family transposase [Thermoanaerobaculia bacterium]